MVYYFDSIQQKICFRAYESAPGAIPIFLFLHKDKTVLLWRKTPTTLEKTLEIKENNNEILENADQYRQQSSVDLKNDMQEEIMKLWSHFTQILVEHIKEKNNSFSAGVSISFQSAEINLIGKLVQLKDLFEKKCESLIFSRKSQENFLQQICELETVSSNFTSFLSVIIIDIIINLGSRKFKLLNMQLKK